MKYRLWALAAAALLCGSATVSAQDNNQNPKSQTKDQIARPDAQPGLGEEGNGAAGSGGQNVQPRNGPDRDVQRTQLQDEQRDQVQGKGHGPQGGQMLRGGEMRRAAPRAMTVEQKTRLRDTIVRTGPRLTNVNFRIGVGARIPRTVRVVAVPQEILAIYPEWTGDLFFAYGDEFVVVAPDTYEIVGVLPL